MEFIGKFHPVFLHLPIGFLIAALAFEWLDWRRKTTVYESTIKVLLGIGAATAVIAALMGYFLSFSGGYEADLLNTHKWSGFGVAICSTVFYLFRGVIKARPRILGLAWAINLIVLSIAGHYGGSLTHGEDYLIESAPAFIKNAFGQKGSLVENDLQLDSAIVFEHIIMPIMERKCWSCHSTGKSKGGLNLDNPKGWEKGGQTGALLVAGKPDQSLFLNRIFLPLSEKEHMPPAGKPQLLPSEVALLEWWIAQGGSFENKVADYKLDKKIDQILKSEFGVRDVYATLDVKPLSSNRIKELQESGIKIYPLAQESPFLEVSFSGDTIIEDEKLNLLKKAKKQIVRLDLSNSAISDEQLKIVGQLPNIVQLFLQNTNVSEAGLKWLEELGVLEYLNLYHTAVGDNGLESLSKIKNLKNVFLWQTNVSKAQAAIAKKMRPDIHFDLGVEMDSFLFNQKLSMPVIEAPGTLFNDPIKVSVQLNFPDVDIRYTLDGSAPDSTSGKYTEPLTINKTSVLKVIAYKKEWEASPIAEKEFVKIRYQVADIKLLNPPNPKYPGEGSKTLMDLTKGDEKFDNGKWLGWEKQDFTAIIDLGSVKEVTKVNLSALEIAGSYIFFPKGMTIELSKDGNLYKEVKKASYEVATQDYGPRMKNFTEIIEPQQARFVKVKVENTGVNPKWHPAPGAPCWVFVDELLVE